MISFIFICMNTYEYQKIRGLKRKLHLIDLRGGKCERCGYDKNLAAFDFHHKDPAEKESKLDVRILSNSKMKWILEEFEKCEVICANCHREEHSPESNLNEVRVLLENVAKSITKVRVINKPKCKDCNCEINYGSVRCVKCKGKNARKVKRPDIEVLKKEIEEHSQQWCADKYGVTRSSIRRWIS